MTSSQERYKANTSNDNEPLSIGDLAYFRQRLRNETFQTLLAKFAEKAELENFTKSDLACRLGKDRGQVTRMLAGPRNWTLDTISDLSLALDTEVEILFHDLRLPPGHNFCHPWATDNHYNVKLNDDGSLCPPSTVASRAVIVEFESVN